LFATLHGGLTIDNDRAAIDRLWNRYVAAWYERGKDDPKLALLRLDAERAEIWLDASSLVAGIKMLFRGRSQGGLQRPGRQSPAQVVPRTL